MMGNQLIETLIARTSCILASVFLNCNIGYYIDWVQMNAREGVVGQDEVGGENENILWPE